MSRTSKKLSKSRFLSGRQCELRLWLEANKPSLEPAKDAMRTALEETGIAVGTLARERYPQGILVEPSSNEFDAALALTATLLERDDVLAIFEAAFTHGGVNIRADILLRGEDNQWDLVEVKSGTRCKAVHELDLALQMWVINGAGVNIQRASVLTLNRDYVWAGGSLDLEQLFRCHERTDEASAFLDEIPDDASYFKDLVRAKNAPEIEPGPQCHSPYPCPFFIHCDAEQVSPEWPLSALPALGAKRREALEEMGIDDIRDIPEDFQLGVLQGVARDAVLAGEELIHGDLRGHLQAVKFPVYSLDFECMSPAIPRFYRSRAYDQIPFQFSVHVEQVDGTLHHLDYLHADASDPRPAVAQALVDALGNHGTVVVYSRFEHSVIEALIESVPALSDALAAIQSRIWDLHAVIRATYYHPEFRGSFSLKRVVPTLVPSLDYTDLTIADGATAGALFENAMTLGDESEREQTALALRQYCERDTLALVRVRQTLAARLQALEDC